jgi:superfamily I DNA/RNA helicase
MNDSALHVPLEPGSQYDEQSIPSKVEVVRCADVNEQAAKALESIRLQMKAYPDELLGIVCPTHEVLRALRAVMEGSDLLQYSTIQGGGDAISFSPKTRIAACTIHAAKGLEFRTVHLLGTEELRKFPHQKNLAFTAVTRAKTTLSVYHTGILPGYFAAAIEVVQPPRPLPDKKQVFGRKKK